MPRDKTASHLRIIAAAKEEFAEFGYKDASMRRIGERAGLTAAGVYRHCRDKADLFDQLVASAAEDLKSWLEGHVSHANAILPSDQEKLWDSTWIDVMRECVYPRMDEYRLLLTKAQGTKYEYYLHDLVSNNQGHMLAALEMPKQQGRPVMDVTENEVHLFLSGYITAIFEPVVHGYSMDEALRCLDAVEAFFMPGWKRLMGF